MSSRIQLAILAAALAASPLAARADTIVTSASNFVTDATPTTSFGLPYTNSDGSAYTTNSVTLADGNVLNVNGDQVAASGTGFAPFTNGYAGDILITNGTTETINFATPLTALGFYGPGDVNSITISVSGTNGFGGAIGDFAFGGFESVPEPASLAALATGILALGTISTLTRRKSKTAA